MEILSNPANEDCISWLPHGCSFRVHDRARFLEEVLAPHYKNKKIKYTSFTRKLSRWDFVRLSSGPDTGAFYHKLFQRDNPRLARRMFCKGERTAQFPRSLTSNGLATLPPHMQAAVAAGLPGYFGGIGWNAALAPPQPQAMDQASQAQAMDRAQQMQMHQQQPPPMMQQPPMMDPMQLQMPQGTMMANPSSHSAGGSTTNTNASASDEQDSSSIAGSDQQQQQKVPAPSANPAGKAIGPADMAAFLASMNNPNISPAVKAQMLAQQQTLLMQQQLILQKQLAASGINVAITPNPPITVPTAQQQQQQQQQQESEQIQPVETEPQPQQEDEEPKNIQEAPAQTHQQQEQHRHQQQSVSRGEIQLEIQRQMELLRAQQAAALQGQQSKEEQSQEQQQSVQQMSPHDLLAAQAAAKLDTSNLQFTPMPAPGQQAPVGAGQEASSSTPGSESGGAVKRAWAA